MDTPRKSNRDIVREAFAQEKTYLSQRAVYSASEGTDTREVAFRAIAAENPRNLLEVGCGLGELSERIMREIGGAVTAIDISERMVALTRQRGVDARLGDVEALTFEEGVFDCVVANWVLHYLPDPQQAIAEIARVLRPGGRLIVTTNAETHMGEIWKMLFGDARVEVSFSRENGEMLLADRFRTIDRIDVDGNVTFPDRATVERFVAAHIGGEDLAKHLPTFDVPLHVGRHATVFVCGKM